MKAVIPLDPLSGEVLAYTTKVSAVGPFVILWVVAVRTNYTGALSRDPTKIYSH
jgi:hypothetical protein